MDWIRRGRAVQVEDVPTPRWLQYSRAEEQEQEVIAQIRERVERAEEALRQLSHDERVKSS